MGFHKGDFYIHRVDDVAEKITGGWIDETNTYGFHKLLRASGTVMKWVATDLNTGLRICAAATRAACMDWINENKELIELQRTKPEYQKHMMWYNQVRGGR